MKIMEHTVPEASSPVRIGSNATIYLAFYHEDYRVSAESSARSKQPVEVGIVGVADAKVA